MFRLQITAVVSSANLTNGWILFPRGFVLVSFVYYNGDVNKCLLLILFLGFMVYDDGTQIFWFFHEKVIFILFCWVF